jgi:threonine dehydratase
MTEPELSISEYAARVENAAVYASAIETPLDPAPRLSARLNNEIWLKREDLQPVFSFKCRGAENRIAKLTQDGLTRGVICSSAGNHAQGVALAARRRRLRAVIVMPTTTQTIKIDAVRHLGGEVLLYGQSYDDAYQRALQIAAAESLVFVHPFADPDVIAGQGTIARELRLQWQKEPTAVFVPVGGGGLISGIGVYLKQHFPNVKLIGVEPVDAATMHDSLRAGKPVTLDRVGTFADGVAVQRVAPETLRLCQLTVDEMLLVDTDQICAAIKDQFEDLRIVSEPDCALALAGLKAYAAREQCRQALLIAIVSGANMNFDRLRHVVERAEIGEQREALFAVAIPERRGAFLEFCEALGERNITEFNYRFTHQSEAHIFVGVSLSGLPGEAPEISGRLSAHGYRVKNLSDDELAKLHVRHMIGGRPAQLANESVYRFEFPERPGALLAFLKAVGVRWNITLFHYRNHGSDYGRVLAGVQVNSAERAELEHHFDNLAYPYWPESSNASYELFLRASE